MAAADLGAAELITLVFRGERAHPGVAAVLAELAAGRDIRVLDLVFVTRTAGDLVRITGARENLHDIGLGALQRPWPRKVNSIAMVPILGHAVFRGRSVRDGAAILGADTANLAHGPRTPEQPEKP